MFSNLVKVIFQNSEHLPLTTRQPKNFVKGRFYVLSVDFPVCTLEESAIERSGVNLKNIFKKVTSSQCKGTKKTDTVLNDHTKLKFCSTDFMLLVGFSYDASHFLRVLLGINMY